MTGEAPRISAAHYFYLLKEDEDSLGLLWSEAAGGEGKDVTPSLGLDDSLPTGDTLAERCAILHRVDQGKQAFCLAMLANLAVVEVLFRSGEASGEGDGSSLEEFTNLVGDIRSRGLEKGVSFFGESTVLVMAGTEAPRLSELAVLAGGAGLPASGGFEPGLPGSTSATGAALDASLLSSDLDPRLAGGGAPRLTRLLSPGATAVDYWSLTAKDPETLVSSLLPELDSRLKELERSSAYFRQQRNGIATERARVEEQVGALLHKHVQSEGGSDSDAGELKDRIGSLSRMFGLLATDSLMARRADNHLRRDVEQLRSNLARLMSREPGSHDEIGDFFLERFESELDAMRGVARDLDYSRQNAEAAIEVVRTRVELLRAEEEAAIQEQTRGLLGQILRLQEEGLALQVAAGLIEFVLIFYYTLLSWEHVMGTERAEHLSSLMRLLPILGIAAGAAIGTHFLARSIKNRTWKNPGLWITGTMVLASLITMVVISFSV
jgi:FtsZ-binding cell division protein ZapB